MLELIVFHCGTHKTGTSSIQTWLYNDRKALLEKGVLYPKTGLANLNSETGFRHRDLLNLMAEPQEYEKLIHEIKTSQARIVVFSCETFSILKSVEALRNLVDNLRRSFCVPIVGLAYFRNVDDFARKHYREFTLRWSNQKAFYDYIKIPRYKYQFNYCAVAENFQKTFKENLLLRNFETIENVQLDIADLLEVHPTNAPRRVINPSISAIECEILRWVNKQTFPAQDEEKIKESLRTHSPFLDDKYRVFQENTYQSNLIFDQKTKDRFQEISNFTDEDIEMLFEKRNPQPENYIAVLRPKIVAYCESQTQAILGNKVVST